MYIKIDEKQRQASTNKNIQAKINKLRSAAEQEEVTASEEE